MSYRDNKKRLIRTSAMGGGFAQPQAASHQRQQNSLLTTTSVPVGGRHSPLLTALFAPLLRQASVARCDDAAASPPPPPPPPPGSAAAPPPPPAPTTTADRSSSSSTLEQPSSADDDAIAQAAKAASFYTNPGPYETAAMDGKRLVALETFDGFRCDINKQISPYMAVVHSFWLGTAMIPDGRKSTYTFLTQIADETGLLMARVDPARGSIDGRVHRALLGGLALAKVQLSVTPDGQGDQLLGELDFGGFSWTGNLKYGSMGNGIVYGCNYFQSITPKLAMGGEGMYIAANSSLLSNYTLKYTIPAATGDEDSPLLSSSTQSRSSSQQQSQPGAPPSPDAIGSSTLCANYNSTQAALTLNYKRVVTPHRVVLGAELQCNPFSWESALLVGAEFKLQRSKMNLCLDCNTGRIQSLVEAKLGAAPGSPTINFSADVDHLKDEMKFGYGINIDG